MENVVNFLTALLVFTLLVDPSGNILKIKVALFSLLVLCCVVAYPAINKYTRLAFYVYTLLALTSVLGFFAAYNTKYDAMALFYKNFMMIWLLPWVHRIRMLEYLKIPAVFISIVVVFIYIVMLSFPILELAIYAGTNSPRFVNTIFMGNRQFLGINIISIYYTSAPVLLLLLSYQFSKYLTIKKLMALLITLLILCPLIMGGTRAMMLSSVAIIWIIILIKLWGSSKGRIIALYGIVITVIGTVAITSLLLNDRGEDSLETKLVLANAFYNHIDSNPMTVLWGNGVGATFDSLGVRGYDATISELFYFELVRWFGIPLATCFLLLYLYPMYLLFRKRQQLPYAVPLCVAFVFYMLLGGTNPYLIGSNGFVALLTMYSYALNPYYEKRKL